MEVQMNGIQNTRIPNLLPTTERLVHVATCIVGQRTLRFWVENVESLRLVLLHLEM